MIKFEVTPELAETIKMLRVQHKVSAKTVADYIRKSPSYMSKLEQGDIKTIDEPELTSIFLFITGYSTDLPGFMSSYFPKLYESVALNRSEETLDNQLWLMDYDSVLRMIPVPGVLVDDLNKRIQALAPFTIDALCARINSNEGIFPLITNEDENPFNEWHRVEDGDGGFYLFIKIRIEPTLIHRLLAKEETIANLVTLLTIVFYILKTEQYGMRTELDDKENEELMLRARKYLASYQVMSIRDQLWLQQQNKEDPEDLTFDKKGHLLIVDIIKYFQAFLKADIPQGHDYLERIKNNLAWDTGYMISYMSLPFFKLTGMNYATRSQMLSEIKSVVQKYTNMPTEQQKIDLYE